MGARAQRRRQGEVRNWVASDSYSNSLNARCEKLSAPPTNTCSSLPSSATNRQRKSTMQVSQTIPHSNTAAPTAAPAPDSVRHSATVRVAHWIVTLCFFALLVTGVEILISHPRFYWGETGTVLEKPLFSLPVPSSRPLVPTGYRYVLPDQNGWSRSLHFQSAWLMVLTGLAYAVFGFATGHFRKNLLPARTELSRQELTKAVAKHLRFAKPAAEEAWSYNQLQRVAYLLVIFVLTPLVIWTGLAMSPAFVSVFPFAVTSLGGQQSARTIHFFVSLALTSFLLVHVVMVIRAGFISRMRAMITGHTATPSEGNFSMSKISRRKVITTGLATLAGAAGLGAAHRIAKQYGLIPPGNGKLYAIGDSLTYASHRLLTKHSMAREFSRSQISARPLPNEMAPLNDEFKRLQAGKFADWRLTVDGMVERPAIFSLDQLKGFSSHTQITMLQCEEGWSYIAEWNGVPLSQVLDLVGTHRDAKYVAYYSFDRHWRDSMDMADALHPQTLLTYGMNGGELPVGHGGPLRVRVPRQLGYKSVKFITRMTVTDDLKKVRAYPTSSYSWYAGI
jgi:DMSO/TMAO reductase YedYZ molybdopterin-dependent catalytic subunit/thiosulfate reductase cytochrome b subunit